jgi:two-component sensor histidine kinase
MLLRLPQSSFPKDFSRLAGSSVVVIGVAALAGWVAGVPWLTSWGADLASLKPISALCFIMLGTALALPQQNSIWVDRLAVAVSMVAVLAVSVNLLGPVRQTTSFGSMMATATGISMALAGLSLTLSRTRLNGLTAVLAALTGLIAIFALIGYVSGVDELYKLEHFNSMSLPTTVAFLILAPSLWMRSKQSALGSRPRSLRLLIVVFNIAIITPLFLFAIYAAARLSSAQHMAIKAQLLQEARSISAAVDREIQGELETLRGLAGSPSLVVGDFAAFHRQAASVLEVRGAGTILLFDVNEQQLLNTLKPYGTALPKGDPSKLTAEVFETKTFRISPLFLGTVTQRLTFNVHIPVFIDGKIRYVLTRSPQTEALAKIVRESGLPSRWEAGLSDRNNIQIAHSTRHGDAVGRPIEVAAQSKLANRDGVIETTNGDQEAAIEAYCWSELTGWRSSVSASKVVLEAPTQALWRSLVLLALLAATLVALAVMTLSRLLSQAINVPQQLIGALDETTSVRPKPTPVIEFNSLTNALYDALQKRSQAEEERNLASADLRRQAHLQDRLFNITKELLNTTVLRDLTRKVFEQAAPLIEADMCLNYRFDPVTQRLDLVYEAGTPPEFINTVQKLDLSQSFCGLTATTSASVAADTIRIAHDVRGALVKAFGVKAYVCHPLLSQDGRVMGTLSFCSTKRDSFTAQEISWLGTLTNVLAQAWERSKAEEQLYESRQELQLALDAALLGWWRYDLTQKTVTWDDRFKTMFGVPDGERTYNTIITQIHAEDRSRVIADIERSVDPNADTAGHFESVFRIVRHTQEVCWIESRGVATFAGAGPTRRAIKLVGAVLDITASKRKEAHRQLLMQEVNHRAKNMLGLVQAIARQTVKRNPADFMQRFSERLQALSANQDLLVKGDWKGIEISDLVRAQLTPFAAFDTERITASGPAILLTPAAAQGIGLALHELATNAAKYGAFSNTTGSLTVEWTLDDVDVTISWTERNGPLVAPPERSGFGTIVTTDMVESSVNGTVAMEFRPAGLFWQLTCPALGVIETVHGRAAVTY